MIYHTKPCASHGLKSYRYRGSYGWIMIGAVDHEDAINEANRSLSHGKAELCKLEVWDGFRYSPISNT